MKIKKIEIVPHTLKFRTPLKTSHQTHTDRKILIIKVNDENGNTGIGECAPMSWFGTENFSDAETQFKQINHSTIELENDNLSSIKYLLNRLTLLPTVRFGLEQALFNLCRIRNNSFAQDFSYNDLLKIKVSSVANIFSTLGSIEKLVANGFDTIKFKVAVGSIRDELGKIKEISKIFGKKIKIRLDANGGWSFEQTVMVMNELADLNIEFLEQPVLAIDELSDLAEMNLIPIAADESLINQADAEEIIINSSIQNLVIKPMFIGGYFASIEIINSSIKRNKKVVISSAFESAVGRAHTILCSSLNETNTANGLDTASYLSNEPAVDKFPVQNGYINFNMDKYFLSQSDFTIL